MTLKLREGAYYRTRSGAVVGPMKKNLGNPSGSYPWNIRSDFWTPEGMCSHSGTRSFDIINEVKVEDVKPVEHVRYINIYTDGMGDLHETREKADERGLDKRIGCKRVVFTEGEWDE